MGSACTGSIAVVTHDSGVRSNHSGWLLCGMLSPSLLVFLKVGCMREVLVLSDFWLSYSYSCFTPEEIPV